MTASTVHRIEPAGGRKARQLVVLLHGYGSCGADLIALGRAWSGVLPDAVFIAPDAPEPLPHESLVGRQWFALSERDMREIETGAEAAAPKLQALMDTALKHYGLDNRQLAVVGFSQGAAMAFQTTLRRHPAPAALLAFSGMLPGPSKLDDIQTDTPVLIVHGDADDVVAPDFLTAAEAALTRAGVTVDAHMLTGLDHSIDERVMVLGGRFLASAFA
ncbi:alpha/beta hydrolase [Roseibium suaedae]|uniref:Phospholipase/carboxylesterase n=1 Tax=Roseibium suaedae TaxID=735517 RepID=A0A1M6ZVX5_9HYPH|nr:dienelactone hydrolase family protein [Roseibium suaedae]SHL34622.1 phospholipase/carboxylesterase [Roseibium suaedae]